MNRQKLSHNFFLDEFVTKRAYLTFGSRANLLFDPRLVEISQFIRNRLGSAVYLNNWYHGGPLQYRGWRPPFTTVGSKRSFHKLGRAIDMSSPKYSPKEILEIVRRNEAKLMSLGLSRVEHIDHTPTWIHMDLAETGLDYIRVFKP